MRLLILAFVTLLASCYIPMLPEEIEAEKASAEATEPVWTPVPLTFYIFDLYDEIIHEETCTADLYPSRQWALQTGVALHNEEYPGSPWRLVGGGIP